MATGGYQQIKTLFSLTDTTIRFVLAGHSQGGKMAAQFAYENKNVLLGLILRGTSHPRVIDLSSFTLPVSKLYASNDGLASPPKFWKIKGSCLPTHNGLKSKVATTPNLVITVHNWVMTTPQLHEKFNKLLLIKQLLFF